MSIDLPKCGSKQREMEEKQALLFADNGALNTDNRLVIPDMEEKTSCD